MTALECVSRADRLPRNRVSVLFASLITVSAIALVANQAHAQQQAEPAELPPVEVTTSAKLQKKATLAKSTKTSSGAEAPSYVPPADVAPAEAAQADAAQADVDPANALGTYNPALDLDGVNTPPGTTLTTAGPVFGYQALSATSSTKTATPIEQIPQSIQVIPRMVIEDQANRSVTEALRNVSNVQGRNDLNIANTELQQLKLRGFPAEQWLDGLNVTYNSGDRNAFANVERIEVLKGPSAILYGGGQGAPVGGAVNVISKLPTNQQFGEIGFTFGSHSFAQPYFDINQPIAADGTVLFRVTGEYTAADSFIDVLEQERYSINPTLTFTNKTDTTVTIQGRKSRYEQQAYQGLPAVGTVTGDFRIDPHLYIGNANIPKSYSEIESVTVTADHKFDSVWSFNVKGRWSRTAFDQNSQSSFTGAPDIPGTSQWMIIGSEIKQDQEEFSINPNLQARFGAGPARNILLLGADYSRVTDSGHHYSDLYSPFGYVVDLGNNPSFPLPYVDPSPLTTANFMPFGDIDNLYVTKGAYGQIQTSLYDRVHLMAGLRVASIEVDYVDLLPTFVGGPAVVTTTDKTKVLPRVGAVFDIVDGLSVYASYSQGMRWAGFLAPPSGILEPEESEQREVGLKFNLASNFSGTVAIFDIDKANVPASFTPTSTVFASQQARGVEADILWQPTESLKVLASYGYVEATYATDLGAIPAGNRLAAVPEHSGRLWVDYAFDDPMLRGWSIGAGIYASSGAYVDGANIWKTAPYFTVDAKIGYENEQFAATFNVKNLTNEFYFEPYPWFEGQVAPGADRQFYGTLVYKY
ncbi:MAG: TonB-dependent siderophore receptor [Hyphomicrobium sp.]|nr:TonB-dependent siderophore receptor [Hyphomicrobium sp.]